MTVYLNTAARHLISLYEGGDFAKDSLVLHATHLMECLAIIIDARTCQKDQGK